MAQPWLHNDVIVNIIGYLNDKNKISLLSTNMLLHKMKNKIIYHDQVNLNKIQHLWYIDQIINIFVSSESTLSYKIPKNVTNVTITNIYMNYNIYSQHSIKHLTFEVSIFYTIVGIPPNVTHLAFEQYFDAEIKNHIPNSVTHLTFKDCNTRSIINSIPLNVTHLVLGINVHPYSIKDCIPTGVTHLTLYGSITDLLGHIPTSVTHLILGKFNYDIQGCIPPSVIHLTFGKNFNQDIQDYIPPSVTHLTFGENFNQDIRDCSLSNVTHLTFGRRFNQYVQGCIPSNVTHLTFKRPFDQYIVNTIPSNVTHLTFTDREFYFNEIMSK